MKSKNDDESKKNVKRLPPVTQATTAVKTVLTQSPRNIISNNNGNKLAVARNRCSSCKNTTREKSAPENKNTWSKISSANNNNNNNNNKLLKKPLLNSGVEALKAKPRNNSIARCETSSVVPLYRQKQAWLYSNANKQPPAVANGNKDNAASTSAAVKDAPKAPAANNSVAKQSLLETIARRRLAGCWSAKSCCVNKKDGKITLTRTKSASLRTPGVLTFVNEQLTSSRSFVLRLVDAPDDASNTQQRPLPEPGLCLRQFVNSKIFNSNSKVADKPVKKYLPPSSLCGKERKICSANLTDKRVRKPVCGAAGLAVGEKPKPFQQSTKRTINEVKKGPCPGAGAQLRQNAAVVRAENASLATNNIRISSNNNKRDLSGKRKRSCSEQQLNRSINSFRKIVPQRPSVMFPIIFNFKVDNRNIYNGLNCRRRNYKSNHNSVVPVNKWLNLQCLVSNFDYTCMGISI